MPFMGWKVLLNMCSMKSFINLFFLAGLVGFFFLPDFVFVCFLTLFDKNYRMRRLENECDTNCFGYFSI